jgi:DNA polymerase-1
VRSLMNFKMQAGGAAMMQLGAIAGTEADLEVWPIHDAFLITSTVERIDEDVAAMREIMSKAGRAITGGLDVRTDKPDVVRWPDRYMDERGAGMWSRVMTLLKDLEERVPGSHEREPTFSPVIPNLPENEMVDATFS